MLLELLEQQQGDRRYEKDHDEKRETDADDSKWPCTLVYGTKRADGAGSGFDRVNEGGNAPAFRRFDQVHLVDTAMRALAVPVKVIRSPKSSEAAGDANFRRPHAFEEL